jgi:hypothetical protein
MGVLRSLDNYLAEIERRLAAGHRGWLARELSERVRVNVGLVSEVAELRRHHARCVALHGGTTLDAGEG